MHTHRFTYVTRWLTLILMLALCAALGVPAPVARAATSGTVVAWGDNAYGQTNVPAGLSGATAVAAGYSHTMALKSDSTVVVWGSLLGTAMPAGLSSVTAIAAGPIDAVALKSDGTVVAWGCAVGYDLGQCTVPDGLTGVTAIAAGYYHTMALKSDGTVVVWGFLAGKAMPAGLTGVTAIAAGTGHSLALKSDGTVVAWGNDVNGQTSVPAGLSGVVAIAAGYAHSVALKSDGTVVAWGCNSFNYGQCTVPDGLTGVTAIAAGLAHTVALKSDGTVVGWGNNFYGQTSVPDGLSDVFAIAASGNHAVAIRSGTAPTLSGTPPAGTYGVPYSFSFTVDGIPAPSLSVSGSLPSGLSLNGATLGGTPTQAGSFSFTLTASNGVQPDASLPVTVVVNPVALTATVDPAMRQYSDPNPAFQVSFGGFVNGDTASVISGSPSCTTSATPSSPAGQYPITCDLSGMSAANYTLPTSASGTLTVVQENAATDYTGDQFVLTAGPKTTTAPVRLAAQLTQEADGHPGDLTLAQVVFELYKSSNLGSTPDLTVGPIRVSAGGAAETAATLATDTWTIKVKVAAGNKYWVAEPVGMSTLTVAVGNTSRRVTGGGWVADSTSAHGKGNFGFTVAPDKQGNPKGNAQYVFRGTDGYTYVVKSTSWQGGGLTFFADPSKARFSGKAVIQQIDASGNVVASQGNASFTVELIDGDVLSPRQSDQYGISVRTSGGALWKQIALTELGGGNVAVKNK